MDLEDKEADIEDTVADMVEFNYLDPLYGTTSKMSYEEWLELSE